MLGILMLLIALILIYSKNVLFDSGTRQDDKKILTLAFIMMVLVFGCRHWKMYSTHDLYNYYTCYEKAIGFDDIYLFVNHTVWMEKGYLALNWLMSRVIQWPQFIFFFEAAFCCGITFRFIYKYSEDVLFSVLSFMSLGMMAFYLTGFRQSMAISLCLLALEMAEKRKIIRFIIFVLAAMSMHQSAVVFLPVYFLMGIKVVKSLAVVEMGVLFLIEASIPFLVNLGNEVFHRDYDLTYTGSIFGSIINILINVFIVFIMIYQMSDGNMPDVSDDTMQNGEQDTLISGRKFENKKFLYILILGLGLYCMRFQASILERISLYFTPVTLVMLPEVIQNGFVESDRWKVRTLFIVVMLFLICWRFGNTGYVLFWSGVSG